MKILVTGGAGYIGSHTCVELLQNDHQIMVIDNLINSSPISLKRVEDITGKKVDFRNIDLLDKAKLMSVFKEFEPDAVIHFAGLKAVGESVKKPLKYYHNNVIGAIYLLEVMTELKCKHLIFSSSATVYGASQNVPFKESEPISATNPYGQTKLMIEQIIDDVAIADPEWSIIKLRYFNPVGAHPSGKIGEDPKGTPSNLFPYVSQVAVGKLSEVSVYGDSYATDDGTGVRDYLHVVDLAKGHVKAVENIGKKNTGAHAFNLGTGFGSSVLDVIAAFEKASGKKIPYTINPPREGDVAVSYADPSKAESFLQWKAEKSLDEMCVDAWRWQSNNPDGYKEGKAED